MTTLRPAFRPSAPRVDNNGRSASGATTGSGGPNAILARLQTTGAGTGGVRASQAAAREDLPRLQQYRDAFETSAARHGVPPALLAAIASRESRGGAALDNNGRGDGGNGHGLMQVDRNAHTVRGGPYSAEHIDQAAGILRGNLDRVRAEHPSWSPEQQMRGAVAAYNFGTGNVRSIDGMDRGTTGNDYSSDVWARAQALAPSFPGTGAGGAEPPNSEFTARPSAPVAIAPATDTGAMTRRGARGPEVEQLQRQLNEAGARPPLELDGKFGPLTEAAVREFQTRRNIQVDGVVGPETRGAFTANTAQANTANPNTGSLPALRPGTLANTSVTNNGAQQIGAIGNVNTNDPTLQRLANGTLQRGPTGYCVRATLDNMSRLGVRGPAATGNDEGNNPRGGMVQLMNNNGWRSISTPGSRTETIRSPYGTVQASVIPAAEYDRLAREGRIPSGAVVFQTRHDSWNSTSPRSRGFDMGIARNGGRTTFNYADMRQPLVYGARTQSVIVLVPGTAVR